MFWKKKEKPPEEPSVAFRLGEAMGRYTDLVIDQIKARDAEIARLNGLLASSNNTATVQSDCKLNTSEQ